jgi:hypothetical protein
MLARDEPKDEHRNEGMAGKIGDMRAIDDNNAG